MLRTSIVIPLYSNCKHTKEFFTSLSSTLPSEDIEVIVVDHTSQDRNLSFQIELVGPEFFGDNFVYFRCDVDKNFATMANFGAQKARGNYLLFLSNDTSMMTGWYQELFTDFANYPNLGATGPVVLNPSESVLGPTVYNLGLCNTPCSNIIPLYQGIPAVSSVAQKRRFFQAISSDCMLIPKELFYDVGMFDERYINGFEDVDLCLKLGAKGYLITVNPQSTITYLYSKSSESYDPKSPDHNLLQETSYHLFKEDYQQFLENDGLEYGFEWFYECALTQEVNSTTDDLDMLRMLVHEHPFWYDGYKKIVALLFQNKCLSEAIKVSHLLHHLYKDPNYIADILLSSDVAKVSPKLYRKFSDILMSFYESARYYSALCTGICTNIESQIKSKQLAKELLNQLQPEEKISVFFNKMAEIYQICPPISLIKPYFIWKFIQEQRLSDKRLSRLEALKANSSASTFSVLIPVYNPDIAFLQEAIDSVKKQSWPHWEICIADDASTTKGVKDFLLNLMTEDARIKVAFRKSNGHIAKTSNTALGLACNDFVVLLDQDDLLHEDALLSMAEAIMQRPSAEILFSDEDKILYKDYAAPYFKTRTLDIELLRSQNCISHLGVYKRTRMLSLGGFKVEYPGSQDYDLALRFIESVAPDDVIHIPCVLYHWRVTEQSTARHSGVKPYIKSSTMRVLVDHLARQGIKANAKSNQKNSDFHSIDYTLPDKLPKVSLLIDVENDLSSLKPLLKKYSQTAYGNFEIILGYCAETGDSQIACKFLLESLESTYTNVLFLPLASNTSRAVRLQTLADKAGGELLCFIDKSLLPCENDWCLELAGHVCLKDVGAVGGKISNEQNIIESTGYVVDNKKQLFSLCRGRKYEEFYYFSWIHLCRTVAALDPRLWIIRREVFDGIGGFDLNMDNLCDIDLFLKLGKQGLRSVIRPSVSFILHDRPERPWEKDNAIADEQLQLKYALPPVVAQLGQENNLFTLDFFNIGKC